MAIPIYESRPYSNPGRTARMSDLMREEAAIRGQTEMEAARASGRMWENLGQQVSGVMSDLAQYEMDKPKREAAKAAAAKVAQKEADDAAVKDVLRKSVDPETGKLDPKVAAREINVIDPERAQAWWSRASEEERAAIDVASRQATRIAQSAGAVLALPGPERQAAYTRVRQEAIDKGLAKPEQVPEVYDEGWLRTTRDQALTVAQQVDEFHRAATRTETERHNRELERNAALGKTPDPAKAGTFEDYLARLAKEQGKTPADLTTKEIERARQRFESSGRAPEKPPAPDRVSSSEKAAAERWKQNALGDLEQEFRNPKIDPLTGLPQAPISEEELEKRKQAIQASYLEQIGVPPTAPPPRPEDQAPPPPPPGRTTPAATRPQVGQVITARGQRVKITKVYPDGSFDAAPVP